jgi:trans-aconitate methyltransferase
MTGDALEAFFTLHRGLPREGPGEPADVAWATALAQVPPNARVLDAACGPGADIAALRAACPEGTIRAVEQVAHFVEEARARTSGDPKVTVAQADMATETGPFDFIWCAGAVYFLGVETALRRWRAALAPGGAIAFSQVCWITDAPDEEARTHWADYADMTDESRVADQIAAAGYTILGQRRLSDAAWEAYYGPLDAAVAALKPKATGALADVLAEAEEEARIWRAHKDSFGYTLFVVRPV